MALLQQRASVDARPARRSSAAAVAVAEDGAQRLVDLVRDRRRQLARHRQPRRMQQLHALRLLHPLGGAAAAPLQQQRGDQQALRGQRQRQQQRLPPVALDEA
jgi:hypothetical protein